MSHPLTPDDLRIGETATAYRGDPVVTRVDTDGDGRVDRVEVDLDADGDAEIVERDTDGDGDVDDSRVDLDGRSDVVGFGDTDGDGHYETLLRDTDGDGVADREDVDVDGDSVADRFGFGLDEAAPFGGPTYAVDRFPEPREGITEPVYAPVVEAGAVSSDFGSGAPPEREVDADREALADSLRDAPNDAFADPLAGTYVEQEPLPDPEIPSTTAPQDEIDFANDVDDLYGFPAETSDVDDAYAEPVYAPVAETSDTGGPLAKPDDDYVG